MSAAPAIPLLGARSAAAPDARVPLIPDAEASGAHGAAFGTAMDRALTDRAPARAPANAPDRWISPGGARQSPPTKAPCVSEDASTKAVNESKGTASARTRKWPNQDTGRGFATDEQLTTGSRKLGNTVLSANRAKPLADEVAGEGSECVGSFAALLHGWVPPVGIPVAMGTAATPAAVAPDATKPGEANHPQASAGQASNGLAPEPSPQRLAATAIPGGPAAVASNESPAGPVRVGEARPSERALPDMVAPTRPPDRAGAPAGPVLAAPAVPAPENGAGSFNHGRTLPTAPAADAMATAVPPGAGRLEPSSMRAALDGTASAKNTSLMNRTEEMIHSGPRSEQTLPGAARMPQLPATRAGAPEGPKGTGRDATDWRRTPIQISEGLYVPEMGVRPPVAQVPDLEVAAGRPLEPRVEQVQQKISQAIVELKRIHADTMTVVLKPDAQTELSLLVHRREGQLEVEAQCRRGDWTGWSGQWGQLQQTLAAQGIRLHGLQDFTPSDGSPHSHRRFEAPPDSELALPRPRPSAAAKAPVGRPPQIAPQLQPAWMSSAVARRWESWA